MENRIKKMILLFVLPLMLWTSTVISQASMADKSIEVGITFSETEETNNTKEPTTDSTNTDSTNESESGKEGNSGGSGGLLPQTGSRTRNSFLVIGLVIVIGTLIVVLKKQIKKKRA